MKKFAMAALVFAILILLYKDFFQEGEAIGLGIAIIFYLAYYLFHYKLDQSVKLSKEEKNVISQGVLTVYLILLVVVFTLLKGKSSIGISFDNIFLWLVLLIAIIELITRWSKVKRDLQESV